MIRKRIILIWCLMVFVFPVKAMTDSLLMAEVARTGVLLRQMQYDSTLVQVRRLLPAAQENGNVLAEAALHGIAGFSLSRSNHLQEGLQEYLRSASIAEQHHLLEKAGQKFGKCCLMVCCAAAGSCSNVTGFSMSAKTAVCTNKAQNRNKIFVFIVFSCFLG